MDGRVTGRVMARPVRAGLVFEPSAETLRFAVEQATLLWGGQYQPFFAPDDLGRIESASRALGIDVLVAVDPAAASERVAALDGFHWHGREDWGPLAPARDYSSHRLLGPERLLDDLPPGNWVLPEWADTDPLDDLFRVWFGTYGAGDQAAGLRDQFSARAASSRIGAGAEVPADAVTWVTPVTATGAAIEYKGMSPGAALVVVDPSEPGSLAALWNARACGAPAFPVPVGHEKRVLAAADAWLRALLAAGELSRWRTGDGRPLGPRIYAWQATDQSGLPSALTDLLDGHGITPMTVPPEDGVEFARGWHGDHPLSTSYTVRFSQPLEADGRVARIPVPGVGSGPLRSGGPRGDVIAVQVEISGASGVRPDWTFAVPGKRSYARLLREYDGVLLNFERPVPDGRVLSASAGDREVVISAVPSIAVLGKLLEVPGWSARQTPGGMFITRFVERLGGAGSTLANQPGARAALTEVARSQRGLPSGAIVQAVKKRQGEWPESLRGDIAAYPAEVFRFLLRQAILRPVLPVECPHCANSIAFRPEDLTATMKCEMCLRDFPLGLALGMKPSGHNDWLYQLAGHMGHERLSEALPVMAALQVLCSRSYDRGPVVPYVLGWEVKGPKLKCEVDIAAVLHYRGLPAVVIGEVKSWQDSIDLNDLSNLKKVQQLIRGQGVECFILAAVMRDLREDEVIGLRDFAQRSPNTLPAHSSIEPVLPIVLTERNLSATRYGHDHPGHWSPADGVLGLAKESCRQNLGMTGLEAHPGGEDFYFSPQWSPGPPATSPPDPH